MATIYYFGNVPAAREEVQEKMALGHFSGSRSGERSLDGLEFRAGRAEWSQLFNNQALNLPDYTPVGIGKPLSIEILCVYTGDMPDRLFSRKKDLLVVSGVKGFHIYDEAPRAINLYDESVEDKTLIRPTAFTQGCPVAYYSDALDMSRMMCSFELVADNLQNDVLELLSRLFKASNLLPVFAPANSYLLAGKTVVEMAGQLTGAMSKDAPYLRDTLDVSFGHGGLQEFQPKQMTICNMANVNELLTYAPGTIEAGDGRRHVALINRITGREYRGDAPYIIVNIDGKKRPELENFAPTLASASLLEKFYGTSKSGQLADVAEKALQLYNDYAYLGKIQKAREEINLFAPESPDRFNLQLLLDAYMRNIRNQEFKTAAESLRINTTPDFG